MRAYVDTSVLTAVYCAEEGSPRAQGAIQKCTPVIGDLVRLEFSATVAKKVRMGLLTPLDATHTLTAFHGHIRQGVYEMTPVRPSHYALANEWLDSLATTLRTLDALHLAVAASEGMPIVTADQELIRCARELKVQVRVV